MTKLHDRKDSQGHPDPLDRNDRPRSNPNQDRHALPVHQDPRAKRNGASQRERTVRSLFATGTSTLPRGF